MPFSSQGRILIFMTLDSPEGNEPLTVDTIIRDYLSYQDADIPREAKERALQNSLADPAARKYAQALKDLFERDGVQPVRRLAGEMQGAMTREATRISVPISVYGRSTTWALWDMAKQYHFFTHQNENDPRYVVADPMLDRAKQREIVNRHIGWEGRQAYVSNQWPQFATLPNHERALELLQKPAKANNDLSSVDLAALGERLRALRVPEPARHEVPQVQPTPPRPTERNEAPRVPTHGETPRAHNTPRRNERHVRHHVPGNHDAGGHDDHGHGGSTQSFIGKTLRMGVAGGLFIIGTFFTAISAIAKQIYVEGEKKLANFWSVLVSSLKNPLGGAPSAKAAPAADKGHDGGHH